MSTYKTFHHVRVAILLCKASELHLLVLAHLLLRFADRIQSVGQPIELIMHGALSVLVLLLLLLVVDADLVDLVVDLVDLIVLNLDNVVHLAHMLSQVGEARIELIMLALAETVHASLELANLAIPNVLVVADHLLLHNKHILLVLELLAHVKHPDEVSDHRDFFLRASLHFHLLDTVKSVAHDGNQEVHEQELSDEGRQDEQNPNEGAIRVAEVLHVELTKSHEVGPDKGIDPRHSKHRPIDHTVDSLESSALIKQEQSV